jgi:hypothetical protein
MPSLATTPGKRLVMPWSSTAYDDGPEVPPGPAVVVISVK